MALLDSFMFASEQRPSIEEVLANFLSFQDKLKDTSPETGSVIYIYII